MERRVTAFDNDGFFLMRTPLLPYGTFFGLSADVTDKTAVAEPDLGNTIAIERDRVMAAFTELRASPPVREAVRVASPDLAAALSQWDEGTLGPDGQRKALHSLFRYVVRMSTRSTPFGLFAGVSIGRMATEGAQRSGEPLVLAEQAAYRRRTSLDHSYLFLLFRAIASAPDHRSIATYRPTSGLYRVGRRVRFAETVVEGEEGLMSHQLVSLDRDGGLDLVVELARDGATLAALSAALVEACGVTTEEATEYLDDLVAHQLLGSDLCLAATGPDPLDDVTAQVAGHSDPGLHRALTTVRRRLGELDRAPLGCPAGPYDAVVDALRALPVPDLEPSRLFQLDLWKPLVGEVLDPAVIADVQTVITRLHAISPPRPRLELDRVRAAFVARYGDQWVPLTVATDPDLGVVADERRISTEATSLLDGMAFHEPNGEDVAATEAFGPRDLAVLDKLRQAWARGDHEITLDDADLGRMALADRQPLPTSFAAWIQLARPEGAHQVLFRAAVGPPGARLLGRFAHGDERLAAMLRHLAEREARCEPDAIFAEIAHLPEGRSGNVVCRPVLRPHDIPYLGRSGAPHQIRVDDLWVRVDDGRFVLWSASLDRRVVPRLSCAHNTDNNTVPLYWFLAELQYEGCCSSLAWDWGPFLYAAHLPRVRIGPVVVSREAWTLGAQDLSPLADRSPAARYLHVRSLRRAHRLPRHVALAEGDNELALDLENPVAIDVLAEMVRSRQRARLIELWPGPEDAGVQGPEGSYTNEIIVPFVRAPAEPPPPIRGPRPSSGPSSSDGLCIRIAVPRSRVDEVLLTTVSDAVGSVSDAVDHWTFDVTRAGAEWWIAVTVHGPRNRLVSDVLPALARRFADGCADGTLERWSVGGEDPSLRGPEPDDLDVRALEHLLACDARAAMALLAEVQGNDELRWQLALSSTHWLLRDLSPGVDARLAAVDALRAARLGSLAVGPDVEGDLSRASRRLRALGSWEAPGHDILAARRRDGGAGELGRSGSALIARIVERSARRLLRPATPAHELVIYDFLARTYRSEAARARLGGRP